MPTVTIDLSNFPAAWTTFWTVIGAVLRREPGLFNAVINDMTAQDALLPLSLTVVLVAGLSEAIAQSAVLFANHVRPRRFVASLLIQSVLFLGGYVLWVASTWVVAAVFFRPNVPLAHVIGSVGLGYAPLVFGFIGLIPFWGGGLQSILYAWALVAVIAATQVALELTVIQAAAACVGGGLLVLRGRATLGRPLVKVFRRVRNFAAGTYLELDIREAIAKQVPELDDFILREYLEEQEAERALNAQHEDVGL